jgi:hypothetical protein
MERPFLAPFRRLLRPTGSRCRYSTPPPHGLDNGNVTVGTKYNAERYSMATHEAYIRKHPNKSEIRGMQLEDLKRHCDFVKR